MTMLSRKLMGTLWLAALLLSLGAGAIGLYEPLDEHLSSARSQISQKGASGDVVIVGIDEASLVRNGGWPWPRDVMADALRQIDAQGPKRILFDVSFSRVDREYGQDPLEVAAAQANAEVFTALLHQFDDYGDHKLTSKYIANFLSGPNQQQAYVGSDLNVFGAAFELNYGARVVADEQSDSIIGYVPSLGVIAAGREQSAYEQLQGGTNDFRIAHFIDPKTVPEISLAELNQHPGALKGKTVIVAPMARTLRDIIVLPFRGEVAGVYLQALGAETLLMGTPVDIRWIPALVVTAILLTLYLFKAPKPKSSPFILFGGFLALNIVALALERQLIFSEILPAYSMVGVFHFLIWRARIRQRNREVARRDQQTGLPNHAAHIARLQDMGADALDHRTVVTAIITNAEDAAVLLTDAELNQFFSEIARRIAATGDNIAVHRSAVDMITWDIDNDVGADPESYARSVRAMMLVPFQVGRHRIRAEVTLGYCEGLDIPATRRLSNAMHAAKRAAGDKRLFDTHSVRTVAEADWRLAISGDVTDLIEKGEMHLAFQPKFDLRAQKIIGAEALMRWTHEGYGNVPPCDFIPLAEEGSAIVDLTEFALRQSLNALGKFRLIDPNFTVAINLSPVLLDDAKLVERLLQIIDEHGYEPSAVMFEITEAARISNVARGIGILESMVEQGMILSIDDYGTGHSTLDYLRIIPAHEVKLDRSFVENLLISAQDRDLVGSTIDLSHKLGLKVVAEGVENKETIDVLGRLGCDIVQGYCIGRPVPEAELNEALAAGMTPKVA